jgi:hypothetical protein
MIAHKRTQLLLSVIVSLSFGLLREAVVHGINLSVGRPDMERALALARWPHTGQERVRFHDRYLILIVDPAMRQTAIPKLLQLEVITEFRRLELMAEEHDRLGDSFGRAGLDEAVAALRPWRGRVGIDAHLQLPACGDGCHPPIPSTEISIDGVTRAAALALRPVLYARTGLSPAMLGDIAEAIFDATSIGQTTREVRVTVDGHELARTRIDFSALE